MKTIAPRILLILTFFTGFNYLFSSTVSNTTKLVPQQEPEIITNEESYVYYEEGVSLNKIGAYHSAEKAFLRAIDLAEKSQDEEILSYSFHHLGNIESWKSQFSQSIFYHKKAHDLFLELNNLEYVAISNNQISTAFESLGEYDSSLVYYQNNIQNRKNIDAKYTMVNSFLRIAVKTPGNFDAQYMVVNSYQKIAAIYARLYNYKLAYHYLQEGIDYAEEIGSKRSLGEIYLTAGQLFLNNHVNKDIALEYLLEAQRIFEESNNYKYLNFS